MADAYDTLFCEMVQEYRDEALRLAALEWCILDRAANLLASLMLAKAATILHGSHFDQAASFVSGVDELEELIDMLGGVDHPALGMIAAGHRSVSAFALVLLDLMVSGAF